MGTDYPCFFFLLEVIIVTSYLKYLLYDITDDSTIYNSVNDFIDLIQSYKSRDCLLDDLLPTHISFSDNNEVQLEWYIFPVRIEVEFTTRDYPYKVFIMGKSSSNPYVIEGNLISHDEIYQLLREYL